MYCEKASNLIGQYFFLMNSEHFFFPLDSTARLHLRWLNTPAKKTDNIFVLKNGLMRSRATGK